MFAACSHQITTSDYVTFLVSAENAPKINHAQECEWPLTWAVTLKKHCWHTWTWSDVCLERPSCCCHCLHSVRSIAALLHEHDCCHKLLNLYREMKHSCNCATNVWLTLWLRKYVSIKHDAQQSYWARKHMLLWPLWKSAAFGKHWILTL